MIIVTGGAGFIGSVLVWELNQYGITDILIVDRMRQGEKWKNLRRAHFNDILNPEALWSYLETNSLPKVEAIFHLGASSATTEKNMDYLLENNVHYSMQLFHWACKQNVPFFYASSAATYGAGELGFSDQSSPLYKPVNPYGFSKEMFDRWVLNQNTKPPVWAGFKFFNVFGPHEYHKDFQASVIFHAYQQIKSTNKIKLFKSYHPEYQDGEQKRDFIYVKDIARALRIFLERRHSLNSGLYNLGTGKARSFNDLAKSVISAVGQANARIEYIDMPASVIHQYQYFTEAPMHKFWQLELADFQFTSLEEGTRDYVCNYLAAECPYLEPSAGQ